MPRVVGRLRLSAWAATSICAKALSGEATNADSKGISPLTQQDLTAFKMSPRVIFSSSFSRPCLAALNTILSAAWMQLPTGQSRFGSFGGKTKGSSSSTALKMSAKSIRAGDRLSLEPKPAPFLVSTRPACCKFDKRRRITTGFVLTLEASNEDVTRSPSL